MTIDIRPLTATLAAEITGFDTHSPIDSRTAEDLRAALQKHHLLLIRDADVTEEEQSRFGEVFGDITVRYRYANQGEVKKTQYVSNTRADGMLGDGEIDFHQDHTFYDKPLSSIILYGVEIPKSGSATKFRKTGAILDHLPSDLRATAEAVKCLHFYNYSGDYTKWQDPEKAPADSPRAWQPLVWTNPKTGERALWVYSDLDRRLRGYRLRGRSEVA